MKVLSFTKVVAEAESMGLKSPVLASNGRFTTLNNRGSMTSRITDVSEEFLKIACLPNTKVLEIGCAYGVVCLEAVKRGAQNYTACDIELKHLQILAKTVKDSQPQKLSNVTLLQWTFPGGILGENSALMSASYDAILAANILHFLTTDEIVESFRKVYQLLKPGGHFYAEMSTPHIYLIYDSVAKEYEAKVENFMQTGSEPPGFFYIKDIVDPVKITDEIRKEMGLTADHAFLFDKRVAEKLLTQVGFELEECKYEPLSFFPLGLDGRESLSIVAKKPVGNE